MSSSGRLIDLALIIVPPPTGVSATDTAAIQAAINQANSAADNATPVPGGVVLLAAGTYVVDNLVIPTGVTLQGAGTAATILKLANGVAVGHNVLATKNFAALTGTNPVAGDQGPWNFAIRDLTIDGNKANNVTNTAVAVVTLYGYGWEMSHVRIRNSNTVGLYSEWSSAAGAPALGDAMEARVYDVKSHDNVSHGVQWNGPHDSDVIAVNAINNGGRGFWIQANGNNSKFTNCHAWGLSQTYAWYVEGTGTLLANCEGEGASTAQCFIGANDFAAHGGFWFAGGGATTGFVIGDGTHLNITGTILITKLLNFTTAGISFAQDLNSTVVCQVFAGAGVAYSGTPAAASTIWLSVSGGVANPGNQIGTGTTFTKGQFTVGGLLQAQFGIQQSRTVLAYSALIAVNANSGSFFDITATNNTAFTISTPTNAADGMEITITIRNASGGALGAVTWGAGYKLAAWVSPATANSRSITFRYASDVALWVEVSRTTVDVPN